MKRFARRLGFLLVILVTMIGGRAYAIDVQTLTSPGGITFWLYEDHNTPITSIDFAFKGAGAISDQTDLQGTANLVSGLLDEGAGPYSSLAFQKQLNDFGASIGFSAGRDDFSGSFTTLSATADQSIELLRLALTKPHFSADAVDRIKRQIAAGIARSEQNPNAIAANAWRAAAYPGHAYGRRVSGSLETLGAIDVQHLRDFMHANLNKSNILVAIVGDVTAVQAGQLIDHAFGQLPDGVAVDAAEGDQISIATQGIQIISLPIPQTIIQFGMPGILRNDPDFIPAYVMNHILGGGTFSSRMMVEIREKRGLTYGVGTGLIANRQAGSLSGSLSTKNESAAEALALIKGIIVNMAMNGVTDQELADAKRYLIGAYPLRFDSNSKIASQLLGLQLADFGPDYFDNRNDMIAAVTMKDIARVARRLLDDDALLTVLVGQPVGVAAE